MQIDNYVMVEYKNFFANILQHFYIMLLFFSVFFRGSP